MTRKQSKRREIGGARERARQRGLWGAICGLTMATLGFILTGYFGFILVDWHTQLYHPARSVLFAGRPVEFWELILVPSLLPFMAAAGIAMKCIIWMIPPLRRLSEKPAKHNPSLGFVPMQKGLFDALKWTWWTIPIGALAAYLLP